MTILNLFRNYPKYVVDIIDEPFRDNDEGDEPELNLRLSLPGEFGKEGSAWATMFDVRLSVISHRLCRQPIGIGDLFTIRVQSPSFIESDPRFIGKQSIELTSFDYDEVVQEINRIVKSCDALSFAKATDRLRQYFHISDL